MTAYIPKQGDIVIMDFSPQAGHEQMDRRPAIVVSNDYFNARSGVTIVCPISNTDSGYPMHVPLDARTTTTGFILCEHVRSVDLAARRAAFKEALPKDILDGIVARISAAIA